MLAVVVPEFGVIYQLITSTTNQQIYADFLTYAFRVIHALVCTPQQKLVLVHDNAKYYRANMVVETIKDLDINELPTIQYSQQCSSIWA